MPWEVRWLTLARAFVGRVRPPARLLRRARPRGRQRIASTVVRLLVAGRQSGQAIDARGIGLFSLAAARQSATVASAMRHKGRRSLRPVTDYRHASDCRNHRRVDAERAGRVGQISARPMCGRRGWRGCIDPCQPESLEAQSLDCANCQAKTVDVLIETRVARPNLSVLYSLLRRIQ
jgi:hypothetical protein